MQMVQWENVEQEEVNALRFSHIWCEEQHWYCLEKQWLSVYFTHMFKVAKDEHKSKFELFEVTGQSIFNKNINKTGKKSQNSYLFPFLFNL